MKKFSKQAGFTIVELMTIVVIIGILSSVILASFSDARKRAKDVSTVSAVSQVPVIAASGKDITRGTFDPDLCNEERGPLVNTFREIRKTAGQFIDENYYHCVIDDNLKSWVLVVPLLSEPTDLIPPNMLEWSDPYYCVDSLGFSGVVETRLDRVNKSGSESCFGYKPVFFITPFSINGEAPRADAERDTWN